MPRGSHRLGSAVLKCFARHPRLLTRHACGGGLRGGGFSPHHTWLGFFSLLSCPAIEGQPLGLAADPETVLQFDGLPVLYLLMTYCVSDLDAMGRTTCLLPSRSQQLCRFQVHVRCIESRAFGAVASHQKRAWQILCVILRGGPGLGPERGCWSH